VFAFPAAADAHAVLVSSNPVDGSRLDSSPSTVTLHFDERVELVPDTARVISSDGARADTGHARQGSDESVVIIPLNPDLPKGSYTATWRVVSADTHIVSGSISFGIRQDASVVTINTTPPPTTLDIAGSTAEGLGYLGVILCFGVTALTAFLWPGLRRARRTTALIWTGWGLLLFAALAALLLQGPRAADAGWAGVPALADLGETLTTGYGIALLVRILALLLVIPLLASATIARRRRSWTVESGVLAAIVLVTIALGGHAGVGDDAWLAIPAAVLHLASMATWLGGLAVLFVVMLPRLKKPQIIPDARLKVWSMTAFVAVVVLIVTGEYQAWRQVQPLQSLWDTPYGLTLLIKLALVCIALVAALIAQRRIVHRQEQKRTGTELLRLVRRSVWIESTIAVLIVATTTVLVSEAPASTTYGPAATLTAPLGPDHVDISIDSTRRGAQRITVSTVDAQGREVVVPSVTGTLSSVDAGIASLNVDFAKSRADPRKWTSLTAVPLPGEWTLTMNVDFDQATAYTTSADYRVW
jgi:copper transport protein